MVMYSDVQQYISLNIYLKQRIELVLLGMPSCDKKLIGLKMEVEDGAYPLVSSININK